MTVFRDSGKNMRMSRLMIMVVLGLVLSSLSCQAFHSVPSPIMRVGAGDSSSFIVSSSSPKIGKKKKNQNDIGLWLSSRNDNEERLVVGRNKENRRIVRRLAILGALETSYLTFVKWTSQSVAFCAATAAATVAADSSSSSSSSGISSCDSVLNSPYATIHLPVGDIALPALGALAYSIVVILTTTSSTTSTTVLWTTALTTVMATFSCFLLSLLWFVLHQSCTYCYISAALSISMALASWSAIDDDKTTTDYDEMTMISPKTLANMGISSVLSGTVAALFLFLSVGNVEEVSSMPLSTSQELLAANGLPTSSTVLTSAETALRPPPITTTSSVQATNLAKSLRKLDATMYGAYWCSHCYDQKQTFGQEAYYNYIRYVECSKDGFDSQTKLCKEKDVPGYPTWEIKGKLYPGEQSLEELEEIVAKSL